MQSDDREGSSSEQAVTHPLADDATNQSATTTTTTNTSNTTASSSLDAKSLLQSAARSILDHPHPPSPGTSVSDYNGGGGGAAAAAADYDLLFLNNNNNNNNTTSNNNINDNNNNNNLQSLQTETLPALPQEQDRKRFVGCLAAVLASAYDWDCQRWEKDDMDSHEAMLYVDTMSEHDDDEDEEEDYNDQVVYGDDTSRNRSSEPQQQQQQQQQRAPLCRAASDSFEISEASLSHRGGDYYAQRGSQQQNQQRKKTKVQITRGRIRRRRYDVLSELLLESAEYLRVEKSQAKAFLPMLSKLLVPMEDASSNNISSSDKRPPLWRQGPAGTTTRKAGSPMSENYRYSRHDDMISRHIDEIEHLRPFLESLSRGAGFRCLSMFLIQHLLHSEKGYDARVRHAVKKLGVILLMNDIEKDPVDVFYSANNEFSPMRTGSSASSSSSNSSSRRRTRRKSNRRSRNELIALATRKFESLEHWVARKLLLLSQEQSRRVESNANNDRRRNIKRNNSQTTEITSSTGISRQDLMRGLKIGGTAVVAGE